MATRKKSAKATTNPEVDAWFDKLDHPQKETMMAVREAFLQADSRLGECIKWSALTFIYEGNLATINPAAKKFVSLMFHNGAEIPGKHPEFKGSAKLVRTMQFKDSADVEAKRAAIKAVAKAWCDWRG